MAYLQKYKKIILFVLIYTLLFILFRFTFIFTLPLLIGFGFAALMTPVHNFLREHFRFKGAFSATVVTTVIFLIVISIIITIVVMLINQLLMVFSEIMASNEAINKLINSVTDKINSVFNLEFELSDSSVIFSAIEKSSAAVLGTAAKIPSVFTMIIVSVFATFYFTLHYPKICEVLKKIPDIFNFGDCRKYLSEGEKMLKRGLRAYLLIYGITFLITLILFFAFGIRFAFLFAILSAVADIIPILGPALIYLPLSLMYYLQGNKSIALALIIALVIISVVRQFIEPKLLSGAVSVHPLIGICALYFALVAGSLWVLFYIMLLSIILAIMHRVKEQKLEDT